MLRDVLQPGIYYLNPRMVKVTIMPVGYDEISLEAPKDAIRFLSSDGYQIEADVTVVWGRTPADAPAIVANIGNTDDVRAKVVEQAIRAVCQNEGANYSAQELIEGETRSKFQDALETALEQQVSSRNIHILLPLIRNIKIKDARGTDQSAGPARDDPAGQHRDRARADQQAEDADRHEGGRVPGGAEAGRRGDRAGRVARRSRRSPTSSPPATSRRPRSAPSAS